MRVISYLFILILILFGVSFASLNAAPVVFNYYFGVGKVPLSLLLAYSLIVGIFIGMLLGLSWYYRQKNTNRRLTQRLKLAEQEVSNLRAIPLKDQH